MNEQEPRVRFIGFEEPVELTGEDEPEREIEPGWAAGDWDELFAPMEPDRDEPVDE